MSLGCANKSRMSLLCTVILSNSEGSTNVKSFFAIAQNDMILEKFPYQCHCEGPIRGVYPERSEWTQGKLCDDAIPLTDLRL